MAKRKHVQKVIVLSLILVFSLFVNPIQGQTITLSPGEEDKLYELPHPGILPDNPFYIVKRIRDTIVRWSTQDLNERAEIQLLQSDKYMGMALELAEKGKSKMTMETLIIGEEMFMEVPVMLEQVKENGETPKKEIITEALESNKRHREAIEEVMLRLPQGDTASSLSQAIELNEEARKRLEQLALDL